MKKTNSKTIHHLEGQASLWNPEQVFLCFLISKSGWFLFDVERFVVHPTLNMWPRKGFCSKWLNGTTETVERATAFTVQKYDIWL